jgi:hypothetical protein
LRRGDWRAAAPHDPADADVAEIHLPALAVRAADAAAGIVKEQISGALEHLATVFMSGIKASSAGG